ncbi:MAG: sarcosine oxidase subunit gamma [Rhodobacter sp.]|nr:sarcosine oxidase subunit gamma [Paracoccaceae bacterium]MCC0075063.1 sarcosine oxidase subunit gamma [Rhodobacter sp.]
MGRARLAALDPGRVTSVAPWPGRNVDAALAPLGLHFPPPGTVIAAQGARIAWAGRQLAFLIGAEPPAALAGVAALTDQSDGWVWVHLSGADASAVLARLTPLDLRPSAFAVGTVARTVINHMQALILRGAEDGFEIAVFASMAGTLHHELTEAMRLVAARARI